MKPLSILITLVFLVHFNTGNTCSGTVNPAEATECYHYTVPEELQCCFVEIESHSGPVNLCVEVKQEYFFALGFMTRITYGEHTNATVVKIECETESKKKTCGVTEPTELYQCRKHSSTTKTCCLTKHLTGHSECALSSHKFPNTSVIHDFYGMEIECASYYWHFSLWIVLGWVCCFSRGFEANCQRRT